MAKIRKRRLKWEESRSSQVVGYKMYWSQNGEVNYNSESVMLGNVTEIVLPDDVNAFNPDGGPVEFGITAVDEIGNESDMVTLKAPYQFSVPKAPASLYLQKLDDYYTSEVSDHESGEEEPIKLVETVGSKRLFKSIQHEDNLHIFDKAKRVAE